MQGLGASSAQQAVGQHHLQRNTDYASEADNACHERSTPNDGQGLHVLTPQQRWSAIERAGCAMEAAYARFKQSHDAADLDRAYHHMRQLLTLAGIPYERSEA